MKKFRQLLSPQNTLPFRNRQKNITIATQKPAFFNINHKKQCQLNNEPPRKQRIKSFKNLVEIEKLSSKKGIQVCTKLQVHHNTTQNYSNNNLFSQLSNKNISMQKVKSPKSGTLKLINQRQPEIKIVKITQLKQNQKQLSQNKIKPSEQNYLPIQKKENQKLKFEDLTEQQKAEIQKQIKILKQDIMIKIREKNKDTNLNLEKLLKQMKNKLQQETDKLVQKILQKRKYQHLLLTTQKEVNQYFGKKIHKTPTTEKTQQTPCFQQYTFKKKEDSVNEFSLFGNTKTNSGSQQNQNQQNLLKKIQFPETKDKSIIRKKISLSMQHDIDTSNHSKKINQFNGLNYGNKKKEIQSEKIIKLNQNASSGNNKILKKLPQNDVVINQFNLI